MEAENPVEEEDKVVAKRARKRSRYLSPPYTDDDGPDPELTNVAAGDMLSALHAAALLDVDAAAGVKVLLRFFGLHRSSSSSSSSSSSRVTAEAEAQDELNPSSSSKKKQQQQLKDKKDIMRKNAAAPPSPRLPLTDIRKNLEKMISSLGRSPSKEHGHGAKLAGEMRDLLAKVEKMLAHHRH